MGDVTITFPTITARVLAARGERMLVTDIKGNDGVKRRTVVLDNRTFVVVRNG